jgi:plasmid stabilization system protein ParE
MGLTFHRLVIRDLKTVEAYYEEEVGPELSRRFFEEFETLAQEIERNPLRYHRVSDGLRRANFRSFPYHFLFSENKSGIRILVLRHHRRNPDYGTGRR